MNPILKQFLDEYKQVDTNVDMVVARNIIKTPTYGVCDYDKTAVEKWYKSLDNKTPDYSVYDDDYYFTDTYRCWKGYSRVYLNLIAKNQELMEGLSKCQTFVDVGNGIGYSTRQIKQMFKNADVYGYNMKDTKQWKFNELMGKTYGYEMIHDFKQLKNIDVIFASEFFEHIEAPIDFLNEILNFSPKYLILANSFNTYSLGHFRTYKVNGEDVEQTIISRIFIKHLLMRGYTRVDTGFWNNKPMVFYTDKIDCKI